MRNLRWLVTCSAGVAINLAGNARAERCIGPKDNTIGVAHGVAAIAQADITWCDDFDTYCAANCGDCDTGDPTSIWPGYPPTPDNLCTDPLGGSETFFRKAYHWPNVTVSNTPPPANEAPGNWPSTWEGWDSLTGWITGPYTLLYRGETSTNAYHTFDLTQAALHKFPGMDLLKGTDQNPLTLRFWMNPAEIPDPGTGKLLEVPPNLAMYVELRMADDHAPTDYVMRNCAPEGQGPYPMVCQQKNIPPGCPATLSTQVHKSLAFGWLSTLDTNPCDVENDRKPTNYHAAVFDGVKWTQLLNSSFPGQAGSFNWDKGQAYFEMKVKTNVIEIKQIAYKDLGNQFEWGLWTSTASVPRQYPGTFNRISIGVAPGCQLNAGGACMGDPDVWRYMTGHADWGWSNNYVDRVALLGGEGDSTSGACCKPAGTCSVMSQGACLADGGTFAGSGTTCNGTVCNGACCQALGVCTDIPYGTCPGTFRGIGTSCAVTGCPCSTPWADIDHDNDVDMNDFAWFQQCFNPAGMTPGCQCADRNHDNKVDATDFGKFQSCASGANIPIVNAAACDQFP